jgi:hypothetical protein
MPRILRSPSRLRTIALWALMLLAARRAEALLNIDGTRNQLFVFGGVTYAYSSNFFAENEARGDYSITAQVGAELQRRAGIIAVNATAKFDLVRQGTFQEENTFNPSLFLEFAKTTGRTTGSLTIQAYRETRSDSAVNLRTSSWNFPVALNLRYPVSEKFYATTGTSYLRRTYSESQSLVNYTDFAQSVDGYYVYTSKLDLLAGYRFRAARTSADERTIDHWFNVGATGSLFSKLSGTVRFGYQFRDIRSAGDARFDHFNVSASLNWPVARKLLLTLQANQDFNTIATGASVDSASVALHAIYSYNRKVDFNATVSTGTNDFLAINTTGRHDSFFSWDAGVRYRMNEHFQMGFTCNYIRNWSTLAQADYSGHGFSLDLSARY